MYDLLVFIGRFQPLHAGHHEVINRARKLAKNVLVLVGSAGVARSTRNPFSFNERKTMIKAVFPDVLVRPIHDHTYNDSAWIMEVQQQVKAEITDLWEHNMIDPDPQIGLIGCEKDHTSYYLKMFPDWDNEAVAFLNPLSATAFREELFSGKLHERWEEVNLHPTTYDWLMEFKKTGEFARLKAEYEYLQEYKKKYGEGPFLTADSLVQVGGKILLVTRGKEYGHGLLALPGGFVNKYERFEAAALRELREETRLRVPLPVLRGSIRASTTFDEPHRSERARLVTQCYHIALTNDTSLPEVRGSSAPDHTGDSPEIDHADWYDLAWIVANEELFFEDHYHIIKVMLGVN
jgi:bifunctional NMN adenylyltransferase/nudix hydrolase